MVRAIESEAKRQIEVIESGGIIVQETRRWDEHKGVSCSMRTKEEATIIDIFRNRILCR